MGAITGNANVTQYWSLCIVVELTYDYTETPPVQIVARTMVDMRLLNVHDRIKDRIAINMPLSTVQKNAILSVLEAKKAQFEATEELDEYVPPEPE